MNATTIAGFVHCMNFISTEDVKADTSNYLLAFRETMNAAADGDEATVCENMQELGFAWLSSAQLDNWSMMCQSSVMRNRLMAKWVADEGNDTDFATMSPSDFDDEYKEYWGNAVDASNSANFNSISENLYGNKMACSNLNSNLTVTPNTVAATCSTPLDWENMEKVQTTLLPTGTTDLLAASSTSLDLCYNNNNVLSAYSDNAYNCCVNSQNSTEFSSCVRTAFGSYDDAAAYTGAEADALGYQNVRALQLGDSVAVVAFANATDKQKVGSYGFLNQMRFHELNCLFSNGETWFADNRAEVFGVPQAV